MRFTTIVSVAAMASGALADVATIKTVFAKIGSLTDTLNSDVQAYSGSIDDIQSDSEAILSAIKSGTSTISGSGDLTSTEALQLQPIAKQLQGKISDVIDSLISQKSALVSDGNGQLVYQSLVSQKDAADGLADATTQLVPQALQSIAAQVAGGVSKELQQGISAFQGTGSGSSSTSESASSTEAPSTTATTASGTVSVPPTYSTGSSAPAPTGTGSYTPTGPASTSPIPTNAAALNAASGVVGVAAVFAAVIGL